MMVVERLESAPTAPARKYANSEPSEGVIEGAPGRSGVAMEATTLTSSLGDAAHPTGSTLAPPAPLVSKLSKWQMMDVVGVTEGVDVDDAVLVAVLV